MRNCICLKVFTKLSLSFNGLILQGIEASFTGTDPDNILNIVYEDFALWVAYYNFLRPHKHNNYKVLNTVEMLEGADNMPGKWQLLIFLGQQTILNLQKQKNA